LIGLDKNELGVYIQSYFNGPESLAENRQVNVIHEEVQKMYHFISLNWLFAIFIKTYMSHKCLHIRCLLHVN